MVIIYDKNDKIVAKYPQNISLGIMAHKIAWGLLTAIEIDHLISSGSDHASSMLRN